MTTGSGLIELGGVLRRNCRRSQPAGTKVIEGHSSLPIFGTFRLVILGALTYMSAKVTVHSSGSDRIAA
jgi:hypothetical protein